MKIYSGNIYQAYHLRFPNLVSPVLNFYVSLMGDHVTRIQVRYFASYTTFIYLTLLLSTIYINVVVFVIIL